MAFTLPWKGEKLTPIEGMHRMRGKFLPRPKHIHAYIDDHVPAEALEATEFGRIYDRHAGARAQKWLHYPEVYERHFGPLRGKPVRILEIGVADGGSLEIWREYFGPEAVIYGIDIDPGHLRAEPRGADDIILGNRAGLGLGRDQIGEAFGQPDQRREGGLASGRVVRVQSAGTAAGRS